MRKGSSGVPSTLRSASVTGDAEEQRHRALPGWNGTAPAGGSRTMAMARKITTRISTKSWVIATSIAP